MIQTYSPNLNVPATRGYCLQYVDDAGNAANRTPNAKAAYNIEFAARRIDGGDSPIGVWVVGFLAFSQGSGVYNGETYYYKDLWHVFFMKHLGGGRYEIRDSEVASGARGKYGAYGSMAEILAWFAAYKPLFAGWSTHCDGREYVNEGGYMNKDELIWSYILIAGTAPSEQELNNYLNSGKSYHDIEEDLKKWVNEKGLPYHRFKAQVAQEISDLQAQVRSLTQQLEAAQKAAKPGEAEKKLLAIKEALDIK